MSLIDVVMIALALLIALAIVAIIQLVLQNGRVLVRLEELERRLDSLIENRRQEEVEAQASLPVGTHAPEFELPALDGVMHRLTDFLGGPLLLVFFDPASLECQALLPDLTHAARNRPLETFPQLILVTTGDDVANHQLFDAFRVNALILLQHYDELAGFYLVDRTPSAYFIESNNRTASKRIDGADAILAALKFRVDEVPGPAIEDLPGNACRTAPIPRKPQAKFPALHPGEPAPDFKLRLIDGGDVSLDDYIGRPLMLVFSDPVCQPCLDVVDELDRMARAALLEWDVLVISRRSIDLNRAVHEQRGWSIPVALQHYWDVSDLYGQRLLPLACVVGPNGEIAHQLVYGEENIMRLAKSRSLA